MEAASYLGTTGHTGTNERTNSLSHRIDIVEQLMCMENKPCVQCEECSSSGSDRLGDASDARASVVLRQGGCVRWCFLAALSLPMPLICSLLCNPLIVASAVDEGAADLSAARLFAPYTTLRHNKAQHQTSNRNIVSSARTCVLCNRAVGMRRDR